jgi:hypothetical protein
MKSKAKIGEEAQNLLWRWESHLAGKGAFEKSFPAKSCDDPLWRLMWSAVWNHCSPHATPPENGFNFSTFTDRLKQAAPGFCAPPSVSPASIKMIRFQASGYAAQDVPAETKGAMLDWIRERRQILIAFGGFFDDQRWHPYQVCLRIAQDNLWQLEKVLIDATATQPHEHHE